MRPLIIFHDNCADGFTGAWVAHRFFRGEVDLHPATHSQAPPDVTDRDVFLIDFCYPRVQLEAMRERARRIVVLDHHKTAAEDTKDCPGIEMVFDMDRCGARLAWDYWFPNDSPPQVLLHVEDQDLGRFALPFTHEIQSTVFSYPYEMGVWSQLMASDPQQLATEGTSIVRKLSRDIINLLSVVTRRMRIAGHDVPVANLPYTLAPDAARRLADGEPFAACYWDTPGQRVFSLRSVKAGIDVSEVAKLYGGGGHRHAAGFRVGYEQARTFELD